MENHVVYLRLAQHLNPDRLRDFNAALIEILLKRIDHKAGDDALSDAFDRLNKEPRYKFRRTYCSQCGQEFGPGDHGYSHCIDHKGGHK